MYKLICLKHLPHCNAYELQEDHAQELTHCLANTRRRSPGQGAVDDRLKLVFSIKLLNIIT